MRRDDFDRIFEEHAQHLFGFLNYRLGDRALAEDLLVDTFERAFRSRNRFDRRRGKEKTWLYTIALNLLRDHQRRHAAEQRALERVTTEPAAVPAESFLGDIERRAELGPALATLSEEEREAVALRFGADLTVPEIAKLTGEPLTTVEGRVYRALRKLRSQLGEP